MLRGEKIVLRPLKKSDYKKTLNWRNDSEITGLVMSHPFPITEELEQGWYDRILTDMSNKSVYFGIDDKDGNFIGMVFLSDINFINGTCKFHIILGPKEAQGKGYGRDALNLINDYVFKTLNLQKITLEVVESNSKAIKLYESIGFKIEGKLERQFFYSGKYDSVIIMSLFRN
ncbi:MAG TPA: GNAT family protein [Ignavibacteriaceae bacterium]|nr:GNAT family protein [Ignavibacteriaceae bacterium]